MTKPLSAPAGWSEALGKLAGNAPPNGPVWPAEWDPSVLDERGLSALDAACDRAFALAEDALAQLIVSKGGRFGPRSERDQQKRSPIEAATLLDSRALIEWLAGRGDDLDSRDQLGCTPLILACAMGHERAALALKEFGAQTHAAIAPGPGEGKGWAGLSALGVCCLAGNERAVSFCVKHRFHARHELDDGGEGLARQVSALRGGSMTDEVMACFSIIRSEFEAAELRKVSDDARSTSKRPGL